MVTVSRESTCPRFCGPPEGVPQGTFHRRKRALPDVYAGARGAWIFMEKAKYLGDHGLPVTHRVMTEDDYERATRQLGVLLPAREFALDKTVPKPIR